MTFRSRSFACPGCREAIAADAAIAWCQGCKGVWVSEAELEERVRIVRSKHELRLSLVFDPSYLASSAQSQRPCPLCREPLAHRFLGDIQVDRCDLKHGIWFDAGELQPVLEAAAQGVAVIGQDGRGSASSVDAADVVEDVWLLAEIAALIASLFD